MRMKNSITPHARYFIEILLVPSGMKSFNNIYILGGHTLSYSYFQKIQKAKKAGLIDFTNCQMIDPNPNCEAGKKSEKVIPKKYSDFVLEYLENPERQNAGDTLIPDHTAKHVMLQVYLDLVAKEFPQYKIELSPIENDLQTPFLYKSEDKSSHAMSYATWTCPADCDEPQICPHIQATRTWDFDVALKNFLEDLQKQEMQRNTRLSVNRFACEILVYEIAQIPFKKITKQVSDFLNEMKINTPTKIIVATHSHCHGIMGQFAINH